jgi:shikimate dehydrogenase
MPVTRLGVLGWPVAHSRSPAIQNAALAALGLDDWHYQLLPVPPELFEETVRGLPGAGFRGANVTIPHKEAALALATTATPRARAIGAANTLSFEPDGSIHADNTDAPGLIAALGVDPAGMSALVLGAGGSARAVVWALLDAGADVQIWNRTHERAQEVAAALGATAVRLDDSSARRGPQNERLSAGARLLVNCTSVGLDDSSQTFKDLPVKADHLSTYTCVVDLVYRSHGTALLTAARQQGCSVVDGLDVLVHQGALSLQSWTGLQPSLREMRLAARDDDEPRTSERPAHQRGGAAQS